MESTLGNELEYFAAPGPTTDFARHADSVAELPSDPDALGQIVRGVMLHDWMATVRGIEFTPERNGMHIVGAAAIVTRILEIEPGSLYVKRPVERRMIGFCYHFALLHCALLRAKGVAARTRCGFANYFETEKWIDHWVVEYWDGDHWHLHDPQIGRDDLTADNFHDGIVAWKLCRAGEADPAVHGNGELWAWDELRGSLVNDIGALNKVEVGNWNWCDLLESEPLDQPNPPVDADLDALAEIASGDDAFSSLREAFQREASIQPPKDVISR